MKKAAFLLPVLILLGCGKQESGGTQGNDPSLPDPKMIANVEALAKNAVVDYDYGRVVNLQNIESFTRYYTLRTDGGRQFVWGELFPDGGRELHIVGSSHMRYVSDGGCNVVSLYYDIKAAKIVSVQCHGLA